MLQTIIYQTLLLSILHIHNIWQVTLYTMLCERIMRVNEKEKSKKKRTKREKNIERKREISKKDQGKRRRIGKKKGK